MHHYPDCFLEYQLASLLDMKDMETLKKTGLLKQSGDLKEVLCPSCDNDHFLPIKVENGKPYCYCANEDTARNYLTLKEVSTWTFDVEAFLLQLGLKLEIDINIEKMKVQGMWQIGGFSKDNTRHNCYYYQGRNFEEALAFIKQFPSELRRYVIFTNKQEISTLESAHELLLVELKELVSIKNAKVIFDRKVFDEFLINGFRNVIFLPKNGDLIVNGEPIASITPSTAEYNFVELLWKCFNEPVSHQKIKRHIYQKTSKDYEDNAQKVCHKQKNKIKAQSSKPALIDKIFKTTKNLDGENAYIMRNPA